MYTCLRKILPQISMFAALLLAVAAPVLAETDTPNEPLKISVGEKAPDFALPSTDGQTVRLSTLAGHTVLIDFYRGYY